MVVPKTLAKITIFGAISPFGEADARDLSLTFVPAKKRRK